jgi:hypothetical protein
MEINMMRRAFVVGVALMLAAGAAHSQRGPKGKCPGYPDCPRMAEPKAQSTAALQVKKAGEISYVSGGVGKAEREELRALEKDFNLKLVFSAADGKYVANVKVVVSDAKGRKLLEHTADGPLFMARLPAGDYSVAATFAAKTQTRKIGVAAKGLRTELLRWSGTS